MIIISSDTALCSDEPAGQQLPRTSVLGNAKIDSFFSCPKLSDESGTKTSFSMGASNCTSAVFILGELFGGNTLHSYLSVCSIR